MLSKQNFFLSSKPGIIVTGVVIGILAIILQLLGNPANMGICVACFLRDTTGALGFHRAGVVQYIRPEIPGMVLGAFIASLLAKEFKARSGSSPLIRFFLGLFAMIGALAFLGCPWRSLLRLAAGDLNAIVGILGLIVGIFFGIQFLKAGFSLGKTKNINGISGYITPTLMVTLLALLILKPAFILFSAKGPGALHAPVFISIIVAIFIGIIAQRSRFCTMGAFRDIILIRDFHLFNGVVGFVVAALIMNLIFKQFNPGFLAQPIAHSQHLWNFLGMVLSGLCFSLAGGCPGRQLFLSGEGNTDSGIFILGMMAGAAMAHNFALAAKPDKVLDGIVKTGGVSINGMVAVIVGITFCLIIGFFVRESE